VKLLELKTEKSDLVISIGTRGDTVANVGYRLGRMANRLIKRRVRRLIRPSAKEVHQFRMPEIRWIGCGVVHEFRTVPVAAGAQLRDLLGACCRECLCGGVVDNSQCVARCAQQGSRQM
jgi:hypothetical protein